MFCRNLIWALPVLLLCTSVGTSARADEADDAVKVELMETGTAPLQTIRYAPRVGETQTAVMTISMDMAMSVAGNAMPAQSIPAQKVTFDTTIEKVSDDGVIEFSFIYTGAEIVDDAQNPSPMAPMLEEMLKPLIGATGKATVTNRGITQSAEFNIPDEMAPQLKQILDGMKESMNRISSPVPSEEIGQGAKWKVTQNLVANGMRVVQTSIHEITKFEPGGFTMSIEVTQAADAQEIKNPGLPPGTKLSLVSLDTSGEGTSQIQVGSLIPEQSSLTIRSKTTMDVETAGQKQQMTTDMSMGMELESLR
ncbi:hypothetical protein [Allorhodopirellula solitaria]|uniref:Uncharacterized protein n=1 Tax=Allorhodopirellula solitaria TaxID=2527987 RepID=A0A5C5YD54_9BACT|nr:hypothetical protein [Allorhodopirellula solitaria]TWT72869.1 hypothetical protein CA85_13300 [Allorhodopirellula solitaria]